MRRIVLIQFVIILFNSLYGQCDGSPTDSTFDVSQCDSSDLQVLQEIISLNGLSEFTNPVDGDDGDGIFEPQELGYQLWASGRITDLNVGSYPAGMIWYITPYGITSIPESIGDLSMLQSLTLFFNFFSQLPQSIGNLSNLSSLQVSSTGLTSLPDSIIYMDNLQNLWCAGNELVSIPTGFDNLNNLVKLDIGANHFSEIPHNIWNLDSLENLDISRNEVSILSDSVGLLSELEYLKLSYNDLTVLPIPISNLTKLNSVYLDSNYLYCSDGSVDTSAIPSFLTDGSIPNVYGLFDQKCDELFDYTSYLPLQVGNVWNYGYDDYTDHVSYISDTIIIDSVVYYSYIDSSMIPYNYTNTTLLRWDSAGYLKYQSNRTWIDFTQAVGDSLIIYDNYDSSYFKYQIIQSDTFVVTTNAGTFDSCVVVSFDDPAVYDDERTYYFAPGVGIVAFDFNHMPPKTGLLHSAIINGQTLAVIECDYSYDFYLADNYPNPFNPITTIQYELPQRSDVQITIYDLLGRVVTILVSETQDAGYKSVQWDATNVSSGMYFYQIRVYDPDVIGAGEFVETRKMVVLK